MEQGLSEANLVLCICSKAYVDKFNSGNGGSGYEGAIMTQPLLRDVKISYPSLEITNPIKKYLQRSEVNFI